MYISYTCVPFIYVFKHVFEAPEHAPMRDFSPLVGFFPVVQVQFALARWEVQQCCGCQRAQY